MTRAPVVLALAGLSLSACSVHYAQTDLVRASRESRTALREATDVTVVSYPPVRPFTFNGRDDERATALATRAAPVETTMPRVRDGFLARLTGDLGYANLARRTELMLEQDTPEAIRAAVTSPLVLDFRTASWGVGNLRGQGEPRDDDPMYVHQYVRVRLVQVSDGTLLWRAVCGLHGYPGDATVTLEKLTEAGGARLRANLLAAADGCVQELVELFQRAD